MDNLARLPPDGIWVYPLRKLRGLCVCGNRSSVHRSQVALDRRLFGVSLSLRLRLGLMDKQLSQLGQCRLPIVGADGIQALILDERQDRFLVAFPIPAFFLLLLVSQGLQLCCRHCDFFIQRPRRPSDLAAGFCIAHALVLSCALGGFTLRLAGFLAPRLSQHSRVW